MILNLPKKCDVGGVHLSSRFFLVVSLFTLSLVFPASSLLAQSFLSLQVHAIGSESDETGDGMFSVSPNTRRGNRILDIVIADEESARRSDVSSDGAENAVVSERNEKVESKRWEPETLTEAALRSISELIDRGKSNLALSKLKRMPKESGAELNEEARFGLLEYRQFLLIKSTFLLGNYKEVEEVARRYFREFSNGKHYYWAYYYFATALDFLEKPLEFVSLITNEFLNSLPSRERGLLRKLLIEDSIKKSLYLTAFSFLENSEGTLMEGRQKWVGIIVAKMTEPGDIDEILGRYQDSGIRSQLYYRKIQLMVSKGEFQRAQEYLDHLYDQEIDNVSMFIELQNIQNYLTVASKVDPHKIGVILPFSHSSRLIRRFARETMDGLELALKHLSLGGRSIQLVVKDSAFIPSRLKNRRSGSKISLSDRVKLVKRQVRELVEEDGVVAILGPLARNTSLIAGEMASLYNVPIISFSQTENIGKGHPFLFRYYRNQTHEAEILAKYAVDYLQAKRFVLFHKSGKKNFNIMRAFGNEIKKNGGVVVGVSRIKRNQVDFNDNFKSFTGGFRLLTEEEEEELKASRDRLEPIVDFDAVFLPVGPGRLKIMIDFVNLFEAGKAWLLAGSAINVRENQLLRNTSRVRFVDAYPVSNVKTYLQQFFEDHWRFYNYRPGYHPPTDYTIFAYEALEIIGSLLTDFRNHNREALRDSVQELSLFPVLTGRVSSLKNRELTKEQKILKMYRGDTVEVFRRR